MLASTLLTATKKILEKRHEHIEPVVLLAESARTQNPKTG